MLFIVFEQINTMMMRTMMMIFVAIVEGADMCIVWGAKCFSGRVSCWLYS